MNSTTHLSTVTRSDNGDGTYRYERNGQELYKASKALYTHFAEFGVVSRDLGPLTLHKSENAALKTKGASDGHGGFYWTKIGFAAIEAI